MLNFLFQVCEKCIIRDCTEYIGHLGQYGHFNNTVSSNLRTWHIFLHAWVIFSFFHHGFIVFGYRSFASVKSSESHSVVSDSLRPHGLFGPWSPPGQNTGVGNHSLLQGLFPTQKSNWGLLHWRYILHQFTYQGSLCFYTLKIHYQKNMFNLIYIASKLIKYLWINWTKKVKGL